jgi:pimeloyl-ACP methyl ester carboxylesterase
MRTLKLFARRYGAGPGAAPAVLLHGLFGSSANWHGIARRLGANRRVLAVDLRNHGRSPWAEEMCYPAMAEDVAALIATEAGGPAVLIGHSMGGKAAMWLALERPELVEGLVVVDIAPATYPARFAGITSALRGLRLEGLADRREADARLAEQLPDPAVRGYLLQNLVREGDTWRWRVNLAAMARAQDALMGFPRSDGRQFPGRSLFVYGSESDYVTGAHLPAISAHFPLARLRAVPNAGHWVYADRPDAFVRALEGFAGG